MATKMEEGRGVERISQHPIVPFCLAFVLVRVRVLSDGCAEVYPIMSGENGGDVEALRPRQTVREASDPRGPARRESLWFQTPTSVSVLCCALCLLPYA